MSTQKTQVDQAVVSEFVHEHFHPSTNDLEQIADGETAQAFFFESKEGPRVVRVSAKGEFGFKKDRLAQERFVSELLPIPRTLEIGEMSKGLHYAVSERAPGKTLDKFTTQEITKLMPAIVATLDTIHAIPPIGGGYGNWDLDGNGKNKSWREMLEADLNQDNSEVKKVSFYDSKLAEKLRDEIKKLLRFCPEERQLIHWDFGFGNALSDGRTITGVIDWEHSAYGDPLQDIAWLDFWSPAQGFAAAFKKHYAETGSAMPNFDERLACYKLMAGLGSLGFYAQSNQPEKYGHCVKLIETIPR